MKKINKQILTICFVVMIFLESISIAFASNDNSIGSNENSLIIDNNKIVFVEDDNTRTSIITNLSNGKKDKIIYYKNENKAYSSFTGKEFYLEEKNYHSTLLKLIISQSIILIMAIIIQMYHMKILSFHILN